MRYIGTISSDARGKLGGMVATRARNGTNFKAHAAPVNPRSVYQQVQRATMAAAVSAWKAIGATNQLRWGVLAAQYLYTNSLAQTYRPSGLQLWVQAYVNSSLAGTTLPAYAPSTPPSFYSVSSIILNNTGTVLSLSLFYVFGAYTGYATFSASSVLSPTINYTKNIRRRPMGAAHAASYNDITSAWTKAYGALPPVGSLVSVRVVSMDSGTSISGTPLAYLATVT